MKTRLQRLKQWWASTSHCVFWGCEPPDDGTWWRNERNGFVVITPATKDHCGRCGRRINAEAR